MSLRLLLRSMVEKYDLDKETEYNQRRDVIEQKEREEAELNDKITDVKQTINSNVFIFPS